MPSQLLLRESISGHHDPFSAMKSVKVSRLAKEMRSNFTIISERNAARFVLL